MKTVFADTVYWFAMANPLDQWHDTAVSALAALGPAKLVTTDEVLTEFLALFARKGAFLRHRAVTAVRQYRSDPDIIVIPQSRESFDKGLERFESRTDKDYSLQDCISMNTMEAQGIVEILSNDRHFEQEGFTVLMKRESGN